MSIIFPESADILHYFIAKNIIAITVTQIVLIFVLSMSLYRKIFKVFSAIQKRTWWVLAFMIFSAALLCVFFIDQFSFGPFLEDTACLAKEIAEGDSSGYTSYRYGIVYPYMLSLLFKLFGVNLSLITILNSILFLVNIVLMFLFSYLYLENEFVSILSSIIYAVNPLVLKYVLNLRNEFIACSTFLLFFLISLYLLKRVKKFQMILLCLLLLSLLVNLRAQMIIFIIPFIGFLFAYKRIYPLRRLEVLHLIALIIITSLLLLTFLEKSSFIASKSYSLDFYRPAGENIEIALLRRGFLGRVYPELSIYFVKNNFKSLLKNFPLFWLFLSQFFLLINFKRRKELLYLLIVQVLFTFGYLLHGAYYSRYDYQDLNVLVLLILFIPWVGYGLNLLINKIYKKPVYFVKILYIFIVAGIFFSLYTYPNSKEFRLSRKMDKDDISFIERLRSSLPKSKQTYSIITLDWLKIQRWKLLSKDDARFMYFVNLCRDLKAFELYFKGLPEDNSKYYNNGFFDITKTNLWKIDKESTLLLIFSNDEIYKKGGGFSVAQKEFMVKSILSQNNAHFLFDLEGYSVYRLNPREKNNGI